MERNNIKNILSQKPIEILALIIGIEAVLVMAGWIFNIDFLTRIWPSGINMKFTTALMFFFSSIGLYLLFRLVKDNHELSSVLLPGIALSIFLIMGVILLAVFTNTQSGLLADITGTQTGLEDLFVNKESSIYAEGSGLPSIITIVCFILFGIACVVSLFNFSKRQKILNFIGWAILIISLISVIGYIFYLPVLYLEIDGLIPVAFNTALSFLLLGGGLIIISKTKITYEA